MTSLQNSQTYKLINSQTQPPPNPQILELEIMKREDFEIMAPVGSRESLAAAINAGANSVYFGIGKLNMRSHSANDFSIEDLKDIARICHENGLKSYLTVNTIIYGEDLATMREIIDAAKEADISAVIASDVAVMTYCREVGQEVHLSTQLNISNIEALKFYAQFADVVVLARELNMWQVRDIYEQIVEQDVRGPHGELIRIEMFCHGALCMAVSGKCYLSLNNANRSANRGECVQICRRGYEVTDLETGTKLNVDNKYIMSPKDLKTIGFMDIMMNAGVRVRAGRADLNMFTLLLRPTTRLFFLFSTAHSPMRRRVLGTSSCSPSSTADSGMATIRVSILASGVTFMVRRLRRRRCMWVRA